VVFLFAKAFFIYWVIMWIKYSVPRLRIDHMLGFNWKFLTPLALTMVIVTAIMDKVLQGSTVIGYALGMLAANVVVGWATLLILRKYAHLERRRFDERRPVASPDLVGAPVAGQAPSAVSKTQ
jgi:hypothetical protein